MKYDVRPCSKLPQNSVECTALYGLGCEASLEWLGPSLQPYTALQWNSLDKR